MGLNKKSYPFLQTFISFEWQISTRNSLNSLHLVCNLHTIQLVTTTGKFKVFSMSGTGHPSLSLLDLLPTRRSKACTFMTT